MEFQRQYPALRVQLLQEARPGLSFARNTGLRQARGDVICFLDDDVLTPAEWLVELLEAFALDTRVGCIAGRMNLAWPETTKPKWVDEKYHGFYSQYEQGDNAKVLPQGDIFYGANFSLAAKP